MSDVFQSIGLICLSLAVILQTLSNRLLSDRVRRLERRR